MADLFQFETVEGYGVVIDMETLVTCWEGQTKDCTVFVLSGADDPIEVKGNFYKFVDDYCDVYDCRPPKPKAKKKPRTTKARGSSSPPVKAEATPMKAAAGG